MGGGVDSGGGVDGKAHEAAEIRDKGQHVHMNRFLDWTAQNDQNRGHDEDRRKDREEKTGIRDDESNDDR